MRKHGWQLPYHPLQVVAIAVFLALGFAFYVFFLPFVGRKVFEYVVMGLYTPLEDVGALNSDEYFLWLLVMSPLVLVLHVMILQLQALFFQVTCVFGLYVWCAVIDPGDPGIFKSKKYLNIDSSRKQSDLNFKQGSSIHEGQMGEVSGKSLDEHTDSKILSNQLQKEKSACCNIPLLAIFLGWCPLSYVNCCFNTHEQSSEQQKSEDGMFYCSLCEVEVLKYSKHCRVCDKCVDGFDHHCRWLNNCIGRRNYGRFFILMIAALLLLILQWTIGIVVLILCFLERKRFSLEINAKLGSSFSLVPFTIVVASCTFLAMLATLPLAQLFFFHVLLIKKGISTYDYIVALREQDQEPQGVGQQSPQMSSVSSFAGLSSASSFNAFRRDAWCTPPQLFLEDQFDVVPPEVGMHIKPAGKRMMPEESERKRSAATVKISPWTLARLNAEEVSKAAAEAKKKSKILQPVTRRETLQGHETDSSYGSGSGRMAPILDNKRKESKRGRLATFSNRSEQPKEGSTSLALQLAARSAFRTSQAMSLTGIVASSPDSSLESPDLHPFRVSSSGVEDLRGLMPVQTVVGKGIQLLRSTSSDGYEASGGEDSDGLPTRIVHRSVNWANLRFNTGPGDITDESMASSSSSGLQAHGNQVH